MNMNRTIRVDPRKGADRETPILNFASAQKEVESLLVIHPATQEDKVSCVGRGIKLILSCNRPAQKINARALRN